jgi:NADH dehydrogenase
VIVVAGGTGRLGQRVVRRLLDRGLAVRVLTRSPTGAAGLPAAVELAVGDVRDRTSLRAAMVGARTVVSAVQGVTGTGGDSPATVDRDGNANLVDLAADVGADVVMMSVVGASPDSPMELFAMKYAAEQHLRASGVPATVVRATAFAELWVEILRKTAGRSGRPVVFGRGDNPVNFVCVDDVAAAVEYAVVEPTTRGTTMQIGGPDTVTLSALAALVQAADGGTGQPRHVPPLALKGLAGSVGRVRPTFGRQLRLALAMDSMDLTFDAVAMRAALPPLPCTPLSGCLG